MIRLTYTIGHYGPTTKEFNTDNYNEALIELAEWLHVQESGRVVTPDEQNPLTVEFKRVVEEQSPRTMGLPS